MVRKIMLALPVVFLAFSPILAQAEGLNELLNREILHGNSVAWSPDGSYIAAGTKSIVYIIDSKSFEVLTELQGHTKDVSSVAFSPNGKYLISGDDAGIIYIWSRNNYFSSFKFHFS